MGEPPVTIIIPAYNSAKYIGQCLDSLIAQTYQNWKAIVVYSSSYDGTFNEVLKHRDSRIALYDTGWKTNVATARNQGLLFAVGEFVAFLDSDDWWNPEKLQHCIDTMNEMPVYWCYHYSIRSYKDGHCELDRTHPGSDTAIGGTGTIVARRGVFDLVGGFDESMDRNDDADMVLRIRSLPSTACPEYLSFQRMRSDGLTATTAKWQNRWIILKICVKNGAWHILAFHVKEWAQEPFVKIKKKVLG
jgi:glycosyltransferase involved in cell wall biosynthesis